MNTYITGIEDTDTYMTDYLTIDSVSNLSLTSSAHYNLLSKIKIYQEIKQLDPKKYLLDQCYRLELLAVIQRYYAHSRRMITNREIHLASMNGHVHVLDWIYIYCKGSNFDYSLPNISGAIANNRINVLEWFDRKDLDFKFPYGNKTKIHIVKDLTSVEVRFMIGALGKYHAYFDRKYQWIDYNNIAEWLRNYGIDTIVFE